MPDQKMTYGQRKFDLQFFLQKNSKVHVSMKVSKLCIAVQAEAIREFANSIEISRLWKINSTTVDQYLLEHGYIEPKTEPEEGKEDE